MTLTYILIIILHGGSHNGITTMQQEFDSMKACEFARVALTDQLKNGGYGHTAMAQGCFRKAV